MASETGTRHCDAECFCCASSLDRKYEALDYSHRSEKQLSAAAATTTVTTITTPLAHIGLRGASTDGSYRCCRLQGLPVFGAPMFVGTLCPSLFKTTVWQSNCVIPKILRRQPNTTETQRRYDSISKAKCFGLPIGLSYVRDHPPKHLTGSGDDPCRHCTTMIMGSRYPSMQTYMFHSMRVLADDVVPLCFLPQNYAEGSMPRVLW